MPLRASCLGSVFPISKSQMAFTGYLLHIKKRYCGESRLDFDFFFQFFLFSAFIKYKKINLTFNMRMFPGVVVNQPRPNMVDLNLQGLGSWLY